MNKQLEDDITQQIKLTSNFDPDVVYMAIRELLVIVLRDCDKLTSQIITRILDTILLFLGDSNKDLQGNHNCYLGIAIDCLSKMIIKLPNESNRQVCKAMVDKLTDKATAEEFRGIYATALNSIIKEVSFEAGILLKDLLADMLVAVMGTIGKSDFSSNKIQ
jgi:hypothetical protein